MTERIDRLVQPFEGGQLARRELVASLLALLLMRSTVGAQPSAPPIPVSTLNHVTLTVQDVRRSVDFYQRIFGMPLITTQGTEADWAAPTIPVLGIRNGPQFIAFARGDTPTINHYCLGMEGFDPSA
jgi:hypothetical protein